MQHFIKSTAGIFEVTFLFSHYKLVLVIGNTSCKHKTFAKIVMQIDLLAFVEFVWAFNSTCTYHLFLHLRNKH